MESRLESLPKLEQGSWGMESVRSPIDLITLEIVSSLAQVPLLTLICFEFVFLWFMIELTISLINHPACSHAGHRQTSLCGSGAAD